MAESHPKDEEKKSSKKLIVIIAVVVLLLAGGAGGYFFFMHKSPDAAQHEAEGGDKHVAGPEHKDDAKHGEVVAQDVYYDLPTPLMVNFPPGSSAKVIKISLTLLMEGESGNEVLKKHEPMIRNNLLMAISSIGAEKAKTVEGKQELRMLMLSEIGKVLEKMGGKNNAKDLYFTEFVMQ